MPLVASVAFVVFGCGSTTERASTTTDPGSETAERPPVTSGLARCAAPETPELTSYLEASEGDGVARHLEVLRDPRNGVWATDSHIRMPMHHATAIRWTNLDDFPLVADAGAARLRFEFTLLTRDVRQVPGERAWRTEYTAEVSSVCEVEGDTAR